MSCFSYWKECNYSWNTLGYYDITLRTAHQTYPWLPRLAGDYLHRWGGRKWGAGWGKDFHWMCPLERVHFSGQGELSRLPWSETSGAVFQSPGGEQSVQAVWNVLAHRWINWSYIWNLHVAQCELFSFCFYSCLDKVSIEERIQTLTWHPSRRLLRILATRIIRQGRPSWVDTTACWLNFTVSPRFFGRATWGEKS